METYKWGVLLSIIICFSISMISIVSAITVSDCNNTANGGLVQVNGNYCVNTFYSSGSLNVTSNLSLTILVVAGGGGGGAGRAGGGGAGGLIYNISYLVSPSVYSIVVGTGGTGAIFGEGLPGTNGVNSSFSTNLIAVGGGGGGGEESATGVNGGSGGGGIAVGTAGGTAVLGATQGFNGGTGGDSTNYGAGGGGGAGGAGANPGSGGGGNGGVGLQYNINGTLVYYSGGGGGGGNSGTPGTGGFGGGGNGSTTGGVAGDNAINGTGGGGGGGAGSASRGNGGNGGSGIVIITYQPSIPTVNLTNPVNNTVSTNLTQNFTANLSSTVGLKNATLYINETDFNCYQEQANVSTLGDGDCGLNYSGVYDFSSEFNDANWTSFIYSSNYVYYWNYTKPAGTFDASLKLGTLVGFDSYFNNTYTINSSCLNSNTIQLRYNVSNVGCEGDICKNFSCYNGSDWITFYSTISGLFGGARYSEEAIIWNISNGNVYENTTTFSPGVFDILLGIPVNLYNGIFNWFVTVFDINSNQVTSPVYNLTLDSIIPQFSSISVNPSSPIEYLSGKVYYFNTTVSNTNGSVILTFNNVNYTASNYGGDNYYVNLTDINAGTYTYYWIAFGSGIANNINYTQNYNYIIYPEQYPQFSSISVIPANGSEYTQGGDTQFHAFIKPTNSTAYITLNGVKYHTSLSFANNFYVDIIDLPPGTYLYNWTAFGNGTYAYENNSEDFLYTVTGPEVVNVFPDNNTDTTNRTFAFECGADTTSALNNITLTVDGLQVFTAHNTTANQTLLTLNYTYTIPHHIPDYTLHTWNCTLNYANNLIANGPTYTIFTNIANYTYPPVNITDPVLNFTDVVTNSYTFRVNLTYDAAAWQYVNATVYSNALNDNATIVWPSASMTKIGNSNDISFVKTIDLPNASGVYGFYYIIEYVTNVNGTEVSSVDFICADVETCLLNLSDINLYACNTTETTTTLNFTLKEEATFNLLNGSAGMTLNYWYAGGGGSKFKIFTLNNQSNNNSNFKVCISPNETSLLTSGTVQYSAPAYLARTYYFSNNSINNQTQNIPLYLLLTTSSDEFTFNVVDQYNTAVPGAYVTVERWDIGTNNFYTISILQTNSNGQATTDLRLGDAYYREVVTYNGVVYLITTPSLETVSTTPKTLLIQTNQINPYLQFNNIPYTFTFDNNTNIYQFAYSDPTGAVQIGCLNVQQVGNSSNTFSSCVQSASGSLFYQLTQNGSYIGTASFILTPHYNSVQQDVGNIPVTLGSAANRNMFKTYGFVAALILIGTLALIGVAIGSIPIAGVLVIAGAVVSDKIGLVSWPIATITGLIALVLTVVIVAVRRYG